MPLETATAWGNPVISQKRFSKAVSWGPTGAMKSVKHSDEAMARMVQAEGLETMPSRKGAKPRVWYKNMYRFTKCFIGGSVVAQVAGVPDCIEGAAVTLLRGGKKVAETRTDTFGDFKFDGLDADGGEYDVQVAATAGKASAKVTLTDTVCIGDLMLEYGGGGHENAGTCQVPNDQAEHVLLELITRINADG